MRMTLGFMDFFPSNDSEETERILAESRQITATIPGIIPEPWKKVVFYFETSLNVESLGMMFQEESGRVYSEEELTDAFSVDTQELEEWMDHLYEMCEQLHGDFWNMTGDAWSRMDITLYPDQEPELSFTMEDWCDVNEELKRALLKRKAFGVVEENDRALLSSYDAYLARHMGMDEAKDIQERMEVCRDLSERFRPHRFREGQVAEAAGWLRNHLCEIRISCTEDQITAFAKELLYTCERDGECLTKKDVKRLSSAICASVLEEISLRQTEYFCLQDSVTN